MATMSTATTNTVDSLATRRSIPGTDLTTYPIGLGCNPFGWSHASVRANEVLDSFFNHGGTMIDTSDSYSKWAPGTSGGESEKVIGTWMFSRGTRDDIVLCTKAGAHPDFPGQSRDNVNAALDASLVRLNTDHIDLYYANYDDAEVPIEEQARTYDELVQSGKILSYGLANYAPNRIQHWFDVVKAEGLRAPAVIQPRYSLVHRRVFESQTHQIAAQHGTAVIPNYTLASGFLTGKFRSRYDLVQRNRGGRAEEYFCDDGLHVVEKLAEVADGYGVPMSAVALNWLLAKGATAPVALARSVEEVPALFEATQIHLSAEDVAQLDKASAPFA